MAYQNGPKIVTSGLVLCLDAGNPKSYPGSGTAWTDLSRNGNNGTLTNGPTFNSADVGTIVFDGSNDYVTLLRPSAIVTGGSISIVIWAKWTSTGTTTSTIQCLLDNNHTGSPMRGFYIQDRPDLSKFLTFGVRPQANSAISTFQVGDGKWRHIVGTNDGTTSRLYIDGRLDGSFTESGGLSTVQTNINIGRSEGFGRYLNGSISQVLLYNRALTATEINQSYTATKGRFKL
jgi:hypothetical protein